MPGLPSPSPPSPSPRRVGARGPPLPPPPQRPPLFLLVLLASSLVQGALGEGELALLADSRCRCLKTMDVMHSSEPTCFCYIPNGAIHLKNVWSTIQVKINSTEIFEVVSVPEEHNCQRSENLFAFLKCLINNIWQPGVSNKVIMSLDQYGDKTCFRIHPLNKAPYTVSAQQNIKHLLDFNEWMLVLFSLLFLHLEGGFEMALAQFFTLHIGVYLDSRIDQFCCLLQAWTTQQKAIQFFKSEKLEVRYLTEEEYQEQGETETIKALEELRQFCSSPEFPSWVAVVKLQHPQKFANFVLGLPHVSSEEMIAHEEQYGIGGALFEQQLFTVGTEAEPDPQTGPIIREENHQMEEERW